MEKRKVDLVIYGNVTSNVEPVLKEGNVIISPNVELIKEKFDIEDAIVIKGDLNIESISFGKKTLIVISGVC